jgi:hypothetical protein
VQLLTVARRGTVFYSGMAEFFVVEGMFCCRGMITGIFSNLRHIAWLLPLCSLLLR